jgi:Protein of unknown function DUF72
MQYHIGCSGWSYSAWLGPFYPSELENSDWIRYYSQIFDYVEIDSSFYRTPNKSMVKNWGKKTAYRALDNPKFILLDEADFFRKGEQEDVRHVSERYIAKSDPYIVMVSTPNAPDGLFEHIEKEDEETCLYKRLLLDYTYGLGRIYIHQRRDRQSQSLTII